MSTEVNHPPHYNSGRIEVIEAVEDWGFGPGFWRGNAIKYAARAGKKNPTSTITDLEKAVWYLNREIEVLKAAEENRMVTRPNDMNLRAPKYDDRSMPHSSATDVLTSGNGSSQAGTVSTARDDIDFFFKGEWLEIDAEGQGKFVVFMPHTEDEDLLRKSVLGHEAVISGKFADRIPVHLAPPEAML